MGELLTLLGLTGLFKIPLSFLICILKTSAFTCLKVFPKSSLKQENKKKEVTFTIYPSKIKYRQVQFTSLGKKKIRKYCLQSNCNRNEICNPWKKVHMTVWHLPYIQDISQVRIPTKSLNFSKLWWCTRQFSAETIPAGN